MKGRGQGAVVGSACNEMCENVFEFEKQYALMCTCLLRLIHFWNSKLQSKA